jgi:spermidine synthase
MESESVFVSALKDGNTDDDPRADRLPGAIKPDTSPGRTHRLAATLPAMIAERWLLVAYACSGFAGLVYEIAWTRLLILHLGHTTAAVSTVTAAFMGGLGLGGALGGRVASRLSRRQALWTYALLELVVALASMSIAGSLTRLTPLFAWAYGEDGTDPVFSFVRLACSFALLLVPGVALGATFPMAVRVAVASSARPGGPAGRLDWANKAGAALGTLLAGVALIPVLGHMGTTV